MKQHLHLTRIWATIVLLALMVACNPKAKVSEPAEWLSEKLSAIDSLMWKLSEARVRVSESLRNERWHSLDGCFRFYNDERLRQSLGYRTPASRYLHRKEAA